MSIEAPTDGDVFTAYVKYVLCPQLRPDQLVVLDNLRAHKVEGVRELIEQCAACGTRKPRTRTTDGVTFCDHCDKPIT